MICDSTFSISRTDNTNIKDGDCASFSLFISDSFHRRFVACNRAGAIVVLSSRTTGVGRSRTHFNI